MGNGNLCDKVGIEGVLATLHCQCSVSMVTAFVCPHPGLSDLIRHQNCLDSGLKHPLLDATPHPHFLASSC